MDTTTSPDQKPDAPEEKAVSEVIQDSVEIVEQISEYGYLITNSLFLIIGGLLAVFILHKLVSKYFYPHLINASILKVIFGTMYVLILVIAIMIALRNVGFDVKGISKIAILTVLVGAVITFYLLPYLPRLPFKNGHMVEINGVIGTVDRISTFHTTIKTFDGTMVFIPNALIMASRIMNYNDTPERRIEMMLIISTDSDMEKAKALFLKIMNEDERVLDKPSPPTVFAMNATAIGVDMTAYCWVKNADWLSARSDLWLRVVNAFTKVDHVMIARPQQEVYVIDRQR